MMPGLFWRYTTTTVYLTMTLILIGVLEWR